MTKAGISFEDKIEEAKLATGTNYDIVNDMKCRVA
jgi:hypothetical protein